MTQTLVVPEQHRTAGFWLHSGRLRISYRAASGTVTTITFPDDWNTLVARVSALEAAMVTPPNSLEDLTYAG